MGRTLQKIINRDLTPERPDIPIAEMLLSVNTNLPSKVKISRALKKLKDRKMPRPDGIPPEALKADPITATYMLHHLFLKIWEQEKVPTEWKNGYLVKLPKKGDLGMCRSWRGIPLLLVPSKVFTRILLDRLKGALDEKLHEEHAGFWKNKSCTDHIATLRIIIEQSIEWQSPLYINFTDFEKAFDSVDRDVIWMLMHHYGIPAKFVTLIQQMYENSTCQVIHDGKLSETFEVKTGIRQGCILSPLNFIMVIDWIMRETVKQGQNGIQWTFTKQLDDLDFADDICLLSHSHKQMQKKSSKLTQGAEKTGLKITIQKTKLLKVNSTQPAKVQLKGKYIEENNKFTYLGSVVTDKEGTDEDVKNRTGKAKHAFSILKTVWNTPSFSTRNKIRIFNTNVKSVLLYGSETWRVTKTTTRVLQTFINKCLRYILKTKRQDKTTKKSGGGQTNTA